MTETETSISVLELIDLVSTAREALWEGVGFRIEQTSDFRRVSEIADMMGKTYYNTYLSPKENDFFETQAYWLLLTSRDGSNAGLVGARYDDTGGTSLGRHYRNRLERKHPSVFEMLKDQNLQPSIADKIKGKICYFGDLYIVPEHRSSRTNYIQIIMFLVFVLSRIKWPEVEWMYSFIRERDLRSGFGFRCGYTQQYSNASSWGVPETGAALHYGLCGLPRIDLDELVVRTLHAPHRLAVVEDEPASLTVANGGVQS